MEYPFGQRVVYTATDGTSYDAVVHGKHTEPIDGDWAIAYKDGDRVVITSCWDEQLRRPEADREIPEYGDLMTMQDFVECVECGGFIDDDGSGNYSDGRHMTDIGIEPSDVSALEHDTSWSHVVWFNR